jgi:hypothetical protein
MDGQTQKRPLKQFVPGMLCIIMGGILSASGLFLLIVQPLFLAKYGSIAAYSDSPYWWCGIAMMLLGGCGTIFSGRLMLRGRWRRALILLAIAFGLYGLAQLVAPPKDRDREEKENAISHGLTGVRYNQVHSENIAAWPA